MYQKDTHMYERMLEKQAVPSIADMTAYCGKNAELFALINKWLSKTYSTVQKSYSLTEITMDGVLRTEKRNSLFVIYLLKTMLLQ